MEDYTKIRGKRQMLLRMLGNYLDSAVYANTDRLRLDPNLRTTYNGKDIAFGTSEIWEEAVRFSSRQSFADPVTGNVVFFGTATNDALLNDSTYPYPKPAKMMKLNNVREYNLSEEKWWYYLVRLKCSDTGLLEEVEEITILNKIINFDVHAKEYPMKYPSFDFPVPSEDRLSRDKLICIAETYFDGISRHIGWEEVLAHPDSQRIEFGVQRTNSKRDYHTIPASLTNPKFGWHIKNRRYPVVDPVLGIAVGFVEFVQRAPDSSPGFVAVEAFKITDGLFREILAFFKPMLPSSGWKGVDRYGN